MKSRLFFAVLIITAISCAKQSPTKVGVHLEKLFTKQEVKIVTEDSVYMISSDSTGAGQVILSDKLKAGYATLSCGHFQIPVYVEPGKDFDFILKLENNGVVNSFSGPGALKNNFINDEKNVKFDVDFSLDESLFIAALEAQESSLFSGLDTMGFDTRFCESERKRLHYIIYSYLSQYLLTHLRFVSDYKPSERYYSALSNAVQEDEALMGQSEYRQILHTLVSVNARKDMMVPDDVVELRNRLVYIRDNIKNPAIAEYLVNSFSTSYVDNSGVDNLDVISLVFDAIVKDPEKKAKFGELCKVWSKLAKGQPAPGFECQDINGKKVSLPDLAGKYVYIDIWATWCKPCCGEIPALKELEHSFKNNNIYFVSLSCDKDKEAWAGMVKNDKLGGIQLHWGSDDGFMSAFMVRGIPRFILLDREGKIISCNMSRPSDPQTKTFLTNLEGI